MRVFALALTVCLSACLSACLAGCSTDSSPSRQGKDPLAADQAARFDDMIAKLTPLQTPLGKPGPSDWLATTSESGQTFAEYRRTAPIRPRGKRRVIYVQPIGPMSERQAEIVQRSSDYMAAYFGVKVKVLERLPLSLIPKSSRRESRGFGQQIRTGYVMNEILRPRLPKDGVCILAFTAMDLYPSDDWNYVFGQAYLRHRTGVWSMARNGDPNGGANAYLTCLRRTIKTATHETGHMFSIEHCIAFECNMCGSMTQAESDRHPLQLCSQCVAKICWGCGVDAKKRYSRLVELCEEFGMADEAKRYRALLAAL